MNYPIRKVVKEKDIFKTSDLVAINNNNETYFIVYNRHGATNTLLKKGLFKEELIKSEEPIILNCNLFN